jgi:Helix-turn-helix domain
MSRLVLVEGTIAVTPAPVAALLGVTTQHLAFLRSRGGGPPYVKESGRVYYPVGELQAWIQQERRRLDDELSTAPPAAR